MKTIKDYQSKGPSSREKTLKEQAHATLCNIIKERKMNVQELSEKLSLSTYRVSGFAFKGTRLENYSTTVFLWWGQKLGIKWVVELSGTRIPAEIIEINKRYWVKLHDCWEIYSLEKLQMKTTVRITTDGTSN